MGNSVALPIDDALPALREALRTRTSAVLEAPPGAGKTTRVPLALLQEPWMEGQRVVMLEPRRLAARAAAHYMAQQLGEQVGGTVGYRVRGETRVGARTRIEVVTEGVLSRLLSADATLDGYGAVLFDEYHERSLQGDLGLALVLETQQVRDDLRVLVMSATLDGDAVAELLRNDAGPAPVVRSSGRMFPIVTHHRPPRSDEKLDAAVSRVVRDALSESEGDVLVFLPGMGEQRRVEERLAGSVPTNVRVHVLHGTMPLAEQDAALAAAPPGMRKVVLSTSVAETSLTVEGVRVVVDGGLSRVPRYDVTAGLTRLHTVRVSRASADQRRGRAGRVAPGVCYRLWDVHEEHGFLASSRPEIIDADLSGLALELADAGISDPATLRWLDVPRAGPFAQARSLLSQLGALNGAGRITEHGRRMAALPLAPRLAHLVLVAAERGALSHGAAIAALLEERDVIRAEGFARPPADMRLRTELLQRGGDGGALGLYGARADRDGVRRVKQSAADIARRVAGAGGPAPAGTEPTDDVGALLALAFPDRVAQRRAGSEGRYLLRNGSGASLVKGDSLYDEPYLAVAELEGQPPEYRISRAAPLTLEEIRTDFGEQIVRGDVVEWDERTRSVKAVQRVSLGAITLEEKPQRTPDAESVRTALCTQLVRVGANAWPWSEHALRLRERLAFVHAQESSWPNVSNEALEATLHEWLAPQLDGVRTWAQLEQVDWYEALFSLVPWNQRAALERLAPTHLEVPSGSRITLDYTDPAAPVLAVKLQEVFGWTSTPMLFDGRVPLTLHLLSPAQRPVQVTRDLAGFWKSSYFDVRKELRGRYPRHPWPDDPLTATATRRAKPRGT